MGRALLLASTLDFKAAVGVELHPRLVSIARRNARLWRQAGLARSPLRIAEADAVEFPLPRGPVVAFLFNPFGAPVLRRLLRSWKSTARQGPGEIDLLYVNYEQEAVLQADPDWRRLYAGKVRRSVADAIADHKIMANQPEGEYASSNWEDCSIWRFTGR